jgi:hypothetical protein
MCARLEQTCNTTQSCAQVSCDLDVTIPKYSFTHPTQASVRSVSCTSPDLSFICWWQAERNVAAVAIATASRASAALV